MNLPYEKMSGAGNTFVVVEEMCVPAGVDLAALTPSLCDDQKEHGGADGLIAVARADGNGFSMRYFNRDGSTGMMCGNGGRCAVRFAVEHGYVDAHDPIEFTNAGISYRAAITDRGVKVWFPDPRTFKLGMTVDLDGATRHCHYADVGTPHAIMFVDDSGDERMHSVDDVDIDAWGPSLRSNNQFSSDGANANFVEITSPSSIRLRTFERGVEAETGACGTGAIASAIISALHRDLHAPIEVTTTSGEKLWVDFRIADDRVTDVSLEGGADVVYRGEFGLAW